MTNKISGTANDYSTAQNVWNTIQYPVTEKLITGQEKLTKDELKNLADQSDIESNAYYAREGSRNDSLLKEMNSFHNYFVKNLFLYKRFAGPYSLFEIACGKGGDIHKWAKANYKLVIKYANGDIWTRTINKQ